MIKRYLPAGLLALLLPVLPSIADEAVIEQRIAQMFPNMPVYEVAESPVDGLYQVQFTNGRLTYITADAQYIVHGNIFTWDDGSGPQNLTARVERQGIARMLDTIPREKMVVFAPDEPTTHITVFTDTSCGYCRLLHEEVEQLNELGIEVRYTAFVRAGMNSSAAEVMESVWCAEDTQTAMDQAKRQQPVDQASCDNPLREQFELGQQIGVQGTPAIFFANGQLQPGYSPAKELAEMALSNQ
ncbi:MAG: protein-disulfide isomerase [Pseudomonadaceae bacterium]|nr:MAG: protein-disulfide isomerase [Pseudomonadaceae bacterium]